jgi:hypothetical protein
MRQMPFLKDPAGSISLFLTIQQRYNIVLWQWLRWLFRGFL